MAIVNGFEGDYQGLTPQQVRERLDRFGHNQLAPEKRFRWIVCLAGIFKEPMFVLLFGAAICYFLLGEPRDGLVMLGFVVFVAGINFFQEYRTDRTLQALNRLTAPQVEVVREGRLIRIDSCELVPGDLMVINEGERLAADGRIIESFDLGVDESILTGESEAVWKKAGDDPADPRLGRVFSGGTVINGTALIEVTATGLDTEYGRISRALESVEAPRTPLEKEVGRLIKICALIGLGCCVVCMTVDFLIRGRLINAILAGVTLAMSVIPEELPVILTVFMAIGAWKLARAKALMRRIPAVEALGSVSILCTDKTGTLTCNRMTLEHATPPEGGDQLELLRRAVLASESVPSDPMEQAIQQRAAAAGLAVDAILANPLRHEYPFRSETRRMGHVWEIVGELSRCIKGSPESILPLCGLDQAQLAPIVARQNELMSRGCRVIAVAFSDGGDSIAPEIDAHQYQFAGLLGFIDPPRPETPAAVAAAAGAGIRVLMITGDHALTAGAIARRLGLDPGKRAVTGAELDAMSDAELGEAIDGIGVFARVSPHHKLRIVRALQARKAVVAMTGDGVNDAPALKAADIGVAMGQHGTEVAREAADMILLDDNFSTIIHAVEDGRRIYDNIRKAIGYVFVIHIPIALLALCNPVFYGEFLLLLPIHVVLLELVIDPTCSIIFERLPAEPDLMKRPPRPAGQALVSRRLLGKSLAQGLVIFGGITAGVYLLHDRYPGEVMRSFILLALILSNLWLVYVNASEHQLALRTFFAWRDWTVRAINTAVLTVPFLLIYTDFGNALIKAAPLPPELLGLTAAGSLVLGLWYDAVKLWRGDGRRKDNLQNQ